ncbi:hypothetical protein OEZ60_03805 [Defluviimonas sp. WL0024]|uniref:Major facilitator superfamily (MFS) profile domain-containing protein n=2 Tax=Albidovulum TaxID=205889 RepID=A0ABT3IZR7_9RHOB|nr:MULTISPECIES: hypothetical protein [Defluviimonas]MCU9847122.1 hypothetical protein [Defluviimonas sp. WL0024]MCW3780922.1 hypothetical protein [Defluviimonas salinarum]
MMVLSFLGPLVASVLYVVVFQKAGFRGPILSVCAAPVLGLLLSRALIGTLHMEGGMVFAFLIPTALSLAPLFVLAFMAWPPVGAPADRTSTEK